MKLSEKDKIILQAIQHRADVPVEQIASLCGFQATTVRRALTKLEDAGIISKHWIVDHSKLGFTNYSVSFALKNTEEASREKIINWIVKRDGVGYFGTIGGEHEYELTYLSKDSTDIANFLDALCEESGAKFRSKVVVMESRYTKFGVRLPAVDKNIDIPTLKWSMEEVPEELKHDRETLSALLANEGMTMSALARKMDLPLSTLKYRITGLEERAIIKGRSYGLHLEKCDYRRFFLFLSLHSLCKEAQQAVHNFCAEEQSAEWLIRGIGPWDFKIIFQLENEVETEQIASRLRSKLGEQIMSLSVVPQFKVLLKNAYPFSYSKVD